MIQYKNKKIAKSKETNSPSKLEDEFLIEYPNEPNITVDTNLEIYGLKKHFQTSMDKEKETKKLQITANYYFTVYFQDEEQKLEFFRKAGIDKLTSGLFVNGFDLAEKMGISIEKKQIKKPYTKKTFKL